MNGAPERHRVLKSKLILRRINFSVYYVLFYLSDEQIYPPRDISKFFGLLFQKNIVAGTNQVARDVSCNGVCCNGAAFTGLLGRVQAKRPVVILEAGCLG